MTGSIGGGGVPPIRYAGDAFAWPFRGPDWFGRMILQGLINIIPIIGWIATIGWMMRTTDNFRAGRPELAPAGFYLARGAPLFFTLLIYGILLGIPGSILAVLAAALSSAVLGELAGLAYLLCYLLLIFLTPALTLSVYRRGFAGGFNFAGIWRTATANTTNTLVAAAVIWLAGIIGGLGGVVCGVGLLFTVPYQHAIWSGAVTWYERAAMGGPASAPRPTTG